jgi:hypothetical protein
MVSSSLAGGVESSPTTEELAITDRPGRLRDFAASRFELGMHVAIGTISTMLLANESFPSRSGFGESICGKRGYYCHEVKSTSASGK